jgi:hypothetical protein
VRGQSRPQRNDPDRMDLLLFHAVTIRLCLGSVNIESSTNTPLGRAEIDQIYHTAICYRASARAHHPPILRHVSDAPLDTEPTPS